MKVAVVLPTLNEAKTIGKLVDSLVVDPYPDKEIIVVDGGSTDKTVSTARKNGATVIEEEGSKSLPNARNQGAGASRAEILCFLDGNFLHVGRNFITNAMEHFEDPNVIGVSICLRVILNTIVSKAQQVISDSWSFKFWGKKLSDASGFTYAKSRVPFVKKSVFEKLGGYSVIGCEDTAFLQKLNEYLKKNPKKKVVDEQKSIVYAHRTSTIREFFRGRMWYGRTYPSYLNRGKLGIWYKLILLLLQPIYLISIISIPFIFISPWFLILASPYIAKLLLIFYDLMRERNKLRLLTPILDFIGGIGFTIGLLQYLVGKKHMSREKTIE